MLNRLKTMTLVFLTSAIIATNIAYAKTNEKLAIDRQGIKVWTYQVANNPMVQYRAETILNTSIENAAGLILDVERGKSWIPNVGEMKIIERDHQNGDFLMYMVIDLPFPLSDRDLLVKARIMKDKDGRIIFKNQSTKDTRIPERNGIVRIDNYKGDWIFQKLGAQQVKVTTTGFADPAGSIPIGFVNNFVQQQPYQMLQRMKEQVKTQRYTQKDLPVILQ